jgi:NAD(P)-dependent dehydrogenase (short-subunit alcohol dehydrogenase family)
MSYIVVTGGAKRIGAEICKHFAKKHYNIILHYNQSEVEATSLATDLRKYNVKVELFKADLGNLNETNELSDFCKNFPISAIINNASAFKNDSIMSDNFIDSLTEHLTVNYLSRVALIKDIKDSLQPQEKLDIINLLDYGMYKVPDNFFSYHMANKMMNQFTQLAARQLAPNIRINSIALGQTLKNEKQSQKNFEDAINATPLKCSSTTDELLQAIDFILSVKSMTGQTICLDGGMSLSDDKYR